MISGAIPRNSAKFRGISPELSRNLFRSQKIPRNSVSAEFRGHPTSYTTNNTSSSHLWTCRVCHFPLPSVCSVECGVSFFINAGMSDCFAKYSTVQIGSSTKMTCHVCLYDALCLEPYYPIQRQHKKKRCAYCKISKD